MTVYGNFEAIKQVFKTTHGSVWSARTAGTSEAPDCCIKLFQLDADMLENRDTTFAQHLLVAAALQQAMANKSEYWAPIYGLGSQGTNAFYVTRLFPRSAQSLIDYKTDLSSAELKIIMLAVIDGLMDLDTAFHRSHGNLKPANVLLADRAKIREGTVVLSDPDAASEDRPSLTRTPDSKALGELLYGLVTHNPHVTARFPLPKSSKWSQLGSTGRQWFAICGNLLNPVGRRGAPPLEHIRSMIDGVHPTRRRFPKSLLAVVLVGALGAGAYVKRDQVHTWYHQASSQMVTLLHPVKPPVVRHLASTQSLVTVPMIQPAPIADRNATASISHPALAEDPIKSAVPPVPPVDNSAKPTITPQPASNPTLVASTPKKPPQHSPPPRDDDGIRQVATSPVPEFHSAAAKDEFLARRDQFIAKYTGLGNAATLGDWLRIEANLEGLDADYPQVDPSITTGWPAGLAGIMKSRRDSALLHAVDGAFDQRRVDSAPYKRSLDEIQAVSGSVATARDALTRGDVTAAKKAIDEYNITLKSFPPEDADVSDLFGPIYKEFASLEKVEITTERDSLLSIADNDGASLGVRLAAWYRLDKIGADPYPSDLATLVADGARADHFDLMLKEAGSAALTHQVDLTENARRNSCFSKLTDPASVLAMLKATHDPKYADLVNRSPLWFRYDAALYAIRTTAPSQVTAAQKQMYSDLAGQVNAPGIALVHDVLKAAQDAAQVSLAQSGPGAIKGWTLRGGWTREHCTYISNSAGDTLEFIRVHLLNDPDGVDCYLCTTEAPVALLQHLLSGDPAAMATAEALNAPPPGTPPAGGMRLWNFNDKTGNIDLDNDDYRKCFVVSPSEQLPAQFVTPQLAFYLARRVGCRLPTSKEWLGALAQARYSADANMKGFATMGWKLRDRQYARLLTNPNRDAGYWPDDNIFTVNSERQIIPTGRNSTIWTNSALKDLGGSTTTEIASGATWPLSTLEASGGFGFRTVGDDENFAGVFHDLVGNVAEFVMDSPVILEEKVSVAPPLSAADAKARISDWFTDEHLHAVSVIGGSALSPPTEDPTKPYPLPGGNATKSFADVGFRLAFTDPMSVVNAERAVIAQSSYLTAPVK
jgi:hypothetical protein